MARIVVILDKEEMKKLMQDTKVTGLSSFELVPDKIKETVRQVLERNTGYNTEPVLCITRVNDQPATIDNSLSSIGQFFEISENDFLIEVDQSLDTIVSIDYSKYMHICNELQSCAREEIPFVLEDLKDDLHLGQVDSTLSVGFVPRIRLSNCKKFYSLSDRGYANELVVSEIKLQEISSFIDETSQPSN